MNDKRRRGWIGVDLDGTLARYSGWKGPTHIGDPIQLMLSRVKEWIDQGIEVRILTARVSHDNTAPRLMEAAIAHEHIRRWCEKHIGCELAVTCVKDYSMAEIWDDRAVQVKFNTGERLDDLPDGDVTP